MKKQWKQIKSVVLLAMLPLVATAAASAHTWMSNNDPIATDLETQVTAKADELGSKRIHTVALNRAGAIEGRIASIDRDSKVANGLAELKIYFVRDGEIAKEAITADDGTFVVQGVTEGAYSFVATGKNGFAAYGVRVVANDGTDELNVMEAAAVSPRLSVVKSILENQLPSEISEQILDSSDNVSDQQLVGSNRVQLENGTLKGHVVPVVGKLEIVEGTYVHILKNDEQVAEVQADKQGNFMVEDLEPGVYDFVAAGPSGFAAVSFEAVNQAEEAGSVAEMIVSDSDEVAVSAVAQDVIPTDIPANAGYSNSLDVCLTCGQDQGFISNQMDYGFADGGFVSSQSPIEYAGESIGTGCAAGGSCGSAGNFGGYSSCSTCGGGGGGGGGGFGGGAFGGRGIGRMLLLGAAIAIPLAVSSNPSNPPGNSPNGSSGN